MKTDIYDVAFENKVQESVGLIANDEPLYKLGINFIEKCWKKGYAYNFSWLGVPVIKLPNDLLVLQELIYKEKPTLIIETGIARCGSLIYFASLLKLINGGRVIGIDIDIREHAHKVYEKFKNTLNIEMIQGSSTSESILSQVLSHINPDDKVMVILDSDHRSEHVSKEIDLYAPLVSVGQFLCITDTFIEDLPDGYFVGFGEGSDNVGNSPRTALSSWNHEDAGFILDKLNSRKAIISENRDGYYKKIK
jgi:cephalosporin hydroxylase